MQQFATLPSLWWALLALPLAFAAWRHHPAWLVPLLFVLGALWVTLRAGALLQQELPRALEGEDLELIGHIADLPQDTDYGARFLFDVESAMRSGAPVDVPARVLLTARLTEGQSAHAGERWRLTVRLTRPHGFRNPGGFDYEAYLFRNGIRARGYVRAWDARLPDAAPRYALDRVREHLGSTMRATLPDHPHAGVIVALANGQARGVSAGQWDVFRATGTLHLVAISGLHISLVGGMAFFLFRFLWSLPGHTVLLVPAPMIGAIGALLAATLYAALAGFVVPTQRALVMLAVAMAGILRRREYPPSELLATALLAVLVFDPLAVMASGFWLSFAAVAVIVFAAQGTARGAWRKLGYLQLAIALGLMPLTLWLFQQVSLVGPLANLLAVPLFDFLLVPLTLAGAGALALGLDATGALLLESAAWLLAQLWPLLEWLAQLPWSRWWQPPPPWWALPCAAIGLANLLAPRGWPLRWAGVAWLLPMVLVRAPAPAAGEVWFTLLDVGQGLAVVVRTANRTLVYDTGPRFSSTFDAGESVVIPYLRHEGVRRIDRLVISHGDHDHAGGVASVRFALPPADIVSSVPAFAGVATPCVAGSAWEWDGVEFEILNPPAGTLSADNNASCVLRVRSAHGALLLTGDIEARAERALVARYGEALAAEVLVAPHHGSRTSSSTNFLAHVRPRHVLYAVGYRNRYRHPHPAVVARYAARDVQAYSSAALGAIEFRFTRAGTSASAYRERARRYWHAVGEFPAPEHAANRRKHGGAASP